MSWITAEATELAGALRSLWSAKTVLLFGPNQPDRAMGVRLKLRNRLREAGFTRTFLVTDLPDEIEGVVVNARVKSFHWVEEADYDVFLFLAGCDNSGVSLELEHALGVGNPAVAKSLCAEEFSRGNRFEEMGIASAVLTAHPGWKSVRRAKFEKGNSDFLLDIVKRFLENKILYG